MTYVTYLFGFPTGSFRIRTAVSLAALPRPRHRRGPGARRDRAGALAPDARPRRAGAAGLRPRLLPADPAVRHLGDRPRAHRLDAVAARRLLRVPVDPPRDHGDRRPALPAVRKVLPHLPAPGAARRQAVPAGGRRGGGRALRPLRRALRLAHARRRPEAGAPASSASTTACTAPPAAGHWQELCPACKRKTLARRPTAPEGATPVARSAAGCPSRVDCSPATARTSTYAPPGGWQRRSARSRPTGW